MSVNYLFIDTSIVSVPNNYNFKIILNEKIKIKKYIKLVQAQIPFDDYLINQYNNTFQVNSKTYTIPIGIYDVISLTNQMQSLIRVDISTFQISFSQLTCRVTFSNTTNYTMQLNENLAKIIGFSTINLSNNNQYITQQTPLINNPQVILINVEEIPDIQIVQSQKYSVDYSFLILNNANRGSTIQYQNQFDENKVESQTDLRQLRVQLYKNDGSYFFINSPIQLLFMYEWKPIYEQRILFLKLIIQNKAIQKKVFLQKITQIQSTQFYYDGARILDAMTLFYFDEINGSHDGQQKGRSDFAGVQYVLHRDLKDVENISILKEELGTDFIEKQMYKQFTRNNNFGENEIKNKFQKNLYNDLIKQKNFLASMFLYFFHKFYYDDENADQMNAFDNYKSADPMINVYKTLKINGLPSAKIIEEIKTVYPYMHNLFVKLLQIKYGESANITLMQLQDTKEALKESELTGQKQKIKVKKHSKLELAKK